ncbi:MAG: acyltransferase [Acidobacteriota bacterium]
MKLTNESREGEPVDLTPSIKHKDITFRPVGYIPAFDGLRGVAVLAVMMFNSRVEFMLGGFIGVDIFFVLSGFLITLLLVQGSYQSSRIDLRDFYFRRALRLFPALAALILTCVAYALLFKPERPVIKPSGVLYTVFYLANWAQAPPRSPGLGLLSHAWSLSVEEQFYIIWPVMLLVLLKLKSKHTIFLILFSLIGISVFLNVWFWQTNVPYLRMYFGSDTRANEILIGCTTALLLSWGFFRPSDRLKVVFRLVALIGLLGILVSLVMARYDGGFVYNGGFTLISIAAAILILDLVVFPSNLSRVFEFAPLVWVGRISYGLYLWHFPIFEVLRRFFEGRTNPVFYQVGACLISFIAASVSYYFLEQPLLKFRRFFEKNESIDQLSSIPTRAVKNT